MTPGAIAIIVLTIIPVVLWSLSGSVMPQFASPTLTLLSLAKISGLVGTTLLCLNFILSARLKFMEKYFGGLDKMYVVHHIVGGLAFVIILLHPTLLLLSANMVGVGLSFYLPSLSNIPVLLGWIAIVTLIVILSMTLYMKLPYELWRGAHKKIGLVLLFGAAHAYFISSDISFYMPLRIYMFILMGLALVAYIYHTVLGRWLVPRSLYMVRSVSVLNSAITQIELAAVKDPITHIAGQFIFVQFDQDGLRETHPFTISSAPTDGTLVVRAKNLGDFTAAIQGLRVGTEATVEGPYGMFTYDHADYARHQLWIAGGIGVTPFLSMGEDLATRKPPYDVEFIYCTRDDADAYFVDNLEQYEREYGQFHFVHQKSRTDGHLTIEKIRSLCRDLQNTEVFLCGPSSLVQKLRYELRQQGVKSNQIHSEEFSLL